MTKPLISIRAVLPNDHTAEGRARSLGDACYALSNGAVIVSAVTLVGIRAAIDI